MRRTKKRLFGILISCGLLGLIGIFGGGGLLNLAEGQGQIPQLQKFLITYYASYRSIATENPGVSEAALAAVTITSISRELCSVTLTWRNEIGGEVCKTSSMRVLPGGQAMHCSRPFVPVSGKPLCLPESTCAVPLDDQEGSILVSVDQVCENQIDIDPKIYYTVISEPGPPPREVILGTHSPRVSKINSTSLE